MFDRKFNSAAVLAVLAVLLLGMGARAHEIRPAIADLSFDGDGGYLVSIALNLEALVAGIGPVHADTDDAPSVAEYDRLRALPPDELREAFGGFTERFLAGVALTAGGVRLEPTVIEAGIPSIGDTDLARISRLVIGGALPEGADSLTWAWDAEFGASVIRLSAQEAGEPPVYTAYLQNGEASEPIPVIGGLDQDFLAVFTDYLVIGFTHILPKGLDHILFVVGLYLLSTRLVSLLWQVTAFTIAHTVTLALAMLDIVSVSPSIVEPLIAASIVYVCVENALTDRLHRWRTAVVFGFGLLHGLGFAGVLTDVGLAPAAFVTGLVAFNIGVELGQLTVIAACFLAAGLWFRHKSWYRAAITIPASAVIAVIGAWWFLERTLLA